LLHGVPPKLILKNGRVLFVFDTTDEMYRLMTMFNSNKEVPCLDLITAIKTLRGQMLTLKETGNGNVYGREKH
jgi:hypothetical protein